MIISKFGHCFQWHHRQENLILNSLLNWWQTIQGILHSVCIICFHFQIPLVWSVHEFHSEGADKEEGGLSLATFPLLAKYVIHIALTRFPDLIARLHRTYHTRKEVSELIFKVIDTDGTIFLLETVLWATFIFILGSGFVAKDELAEALRHFGNQTLRPQLKAICDIHLDLTCVCSNLRQGFMWQRSSLHKW